MDKTRNNPDLNNIIYIGNIGRLSKFADYNQTKQNPLTKIEDYDTSNYLFNAIDIYWEEIKPNPKSLPENQVKALKTTGDFLEYVYNARNKDTSSMSINTSSYVDLKYYNSDNGINKLKEEYNLLSELYNKVKALDDAKDNNTKYYDLSLNPIRIKYWSEEVVDSMNNVLNRPEGQVSYNPTLIPADGAWTDTFSMEPRKTYEIHIAVDSPDFSGLTLEYYGDITHTQSYSLFGNPISTKWLNFEHSNGQDWDYNMSPWGKEDGHFWGYDVIIENPAKGLYRLNATNTCDTIDFAHY